MKLESYKAGIYTKIEDYKAFILSGINYNWSWEDAKINNILAEASRLLGELNAYSSKVEKIDTYLKMFTKFEANASCKIDGINENIEDVLNMPKDANKEKLNNLEEIENCLEAINYGHDKVREGAKITTNLLSDINKILFQNERFESLKPGKLRTSQNFVGGESVHSAEFVPPPHTEIIECLTDFEKFIENDNTDTPDLIKISMLHYQFETIHPFLGGNGRIGRMLVPMYLQSKGFLDKSCLYISNYLEKNRDTYFEKLNEVRKSSDILGWIKFFLKVILETEKEELTKIKRLEELNNETEELAKELPVKEGNAKPVIDVLYENPIASRKEILEKSKQKSSTLNTTINSLAEKGLIEEITGQGRNQIFAFKKYIDIFK